MVHEPVSRDIVFVSRDIVVPLSRDRIVVSLSDDLLLLHVLPLVVVASVQSGGGAHG